MTYTAFLQELRLVLEYSQRQLKALWPEFDKAKLSDTLWKALRDKEAGNLRKADELYGPVCNAKKLVTEIILKFSEDEEYSNLMRRYYEAIAEAKEYAKLWNGLPWDSWLIARVMTIEDQFQKAGYHIDCGFKAWRLAEAKNKA